MNFLAILVSAVVMMIIGMIWYNPKVFGNAWMKEIGMTEESAKQGNMFKIFGFAFFFAFLIAFSLPASVIHEFGAAQLNGGDATNPAYLEYVAACGEKFRTFKHGSLHGAILGVFFALPLVGMTAMFEHRTWKYIFIHAVYFIVSLTIMGGIICAWK
jgi:hypothetical protein